MFIKIVLIAALTLSTLSSSAGAEDTAEKKALQEISRAADAWGFAWGDFCRRNIFGQNAMSWELSPGPDSVNKEPWRAYCDGYFDAMFDLMQGYKLICLPEGARRFEIKGSVIAAYGKASQKEKKVPPPAFAMGVWMESFPCKSN